MEIWKDVPEHKNYQVSNLGRVKRLPCKVIYSNGHEANYTEKILGTEVCKGYLRVTVCQNNKPKRFQVHRLVAMVFIPNPENKPCVNHKNGIKSDNRAENLEWVTYAENEQHSYNVLGKKSHNRKLKEIDILDIRTNATKGVGSRRGNATLFALKYGVSKETVLNILKSKYYVSA